MVHTRWDRQPKLHEPVIVAAFEGWNDAGDAATLAARYLRDQWELEEVAEIDPEEFFDFTTTRPEVKLRDGLHREITWPANRFFAGHAPGGPDVLFLIGTEPQLRWRTFCREVVDAATRVDARLVVTLGALLADVPHTRPVPIVGTAYDAGVIDELSLERSTYEGPTGIVGVLHHACLSDDLPSASLWAAVPTYVPGATSPKAALALIDRLAALLGVRVETADLEIAAASYERQVSDLVDGDDDLQDYVHRLEEQQEEVSALPDSADFIAEVERYLRDRND